jgi:hypothetical protein
MRSEQRAIMGPPQKGPRQLALNPPNHKFGKKGNRSFAMTHKPFARLACALLLAIPVAAYAGSGDTPPLPDRNPERLHKPARNPTRAEAPVLPGDAPTVAWTESEVAAAKARCAKLLAGLAIEYEPLPPLKEGLCGTPAPIRVKSIGSDPKVAIDPPATVTCAVAAGVGAWLSRTVQPKARALIGAPVVKLSNASSYVCRNRYNGTDTKLSEHALANALDVTEFVFQSGEKVTVLGSWPRVAAADTTGSITPAQATRPNADDAVQVTKAKVSARVNPFAVPIDAKSNPFVLPTVAAKVPPPAPSAEASAPEPKAAPDRTAEFVRKVHDDACSIFGTVLGPEANDAHKNHFHLDMKKRRRSAFCE